ncbi:hypothetical protein Acr_18g0001640 [Actinidia rufa]|uniref:Cupin type-1 domain-containing protein n=1 Tax=Actinidia rufa TaxID=165716 RepID=A0A7J0G5C4_9ERIC|nr:hypothetical protein Acr_18g0001640 [Actinidia rufa]
MEYKHKLFTLAIAFIALRMAMAGDPDIISDFIVPPNTTIVDGNLFTFTGMRVLVDAPFPTTFKVLKASMAEFPVLNGQSVSSAVLQYPASSINPPHTHPRSAELLFLLGLVHFQYNSDAKNPAEAVSAFGSASAGTVSVPSAVFNTSIDDGILAKSFKTDIATIQKIKAGLSPRA